MLGFGVGHLLVRVNSARLLKYHRTKEKKPEVELNCIHGMK